MSFLTAEVFIPGVGGENVKKVDLFVSVLPSCPVWGPSSNTDTITLTISATCQKTYWYVEDGSKIKKYRVSTFSFKCM